MHLPKDRPVAANLVSSVSANGSDLSNTRQSRTQRSVGVGVEMLALNQLRLQMPNHFDHSHQALQSRPGIPYMVNRHSQCRNRSFPILAARQAEQIQLCPAFREGLQNIEQLALRSALSQGSGKEANPKVSKRRKRAIVLH